MTLKQILSFDVNRILRWDVGAALTRPITNPFLKFAAGWMVGGMALAIGSMIVGISLSDEALRLLAIGPGILFAMTPPHRRSVTPKESRQ
jgi:hypothetical protein